MGGSTNACPMSRFSSESIYDLTTPACQRLEQNSVLNSLFLGKYTLQEYRQVLILLYQFYSVIEYRLVQMGMGNHAGPLFYTHLKTPLLEADLDVLEYPAKSCPLPLRMGLSTREFTMNEALGSWFVLEQASATWSRLNRLLKRRYGIDGSTGLAFFTNYGNRFDFFWEDYFYFLQSHLRGSTAIAEFIHCAERTAVLLDRWLETGFSGQDRPEDHWQSLESAIIWEEPEDAPPPGTIAEDSLATDLQNRSSPGAEARARRSRLEAFAREQLRKGES